MKSKWPDFLFTLAVRFISGVILGGLACFVIAYKSILRAFSHDNTHAPLIWLAIFAVGGGIIAVATTPYWQTPWYKGIRDKDKD